MKSAKVKEPTKEQIELKNSLNSWAFTLARNYSLQNAYLAMKSDNQELCETELKMVFYFNEKVIEAKKR